MRFTAIDLEIANPTLTSICQAGLVVFENETEVLARSILIDPRDYFDPYHSSLHGIEPQHVIGMPEFAAALPEIDACVSGGIAVCHTAFDRTALTQTWSLHGSQPMTCRWLDSARVARRAWPQFAQRGYGLANLAREFGIKFRHHDAVEDARTTGLLLIKAINDTGIALEDWFSRVERSVSGRSAYPDAIRLEGGDDGPLAGEVCVFTGELEIPRQEAAKLANDAGAAIHPNVTKKTTLVVVGNQDVQKLAGKSKSSKHIKAEKLSSDGLPIRIIREADFMALLEH